jgi:N-acetylmuramoyl-L-alanine amidase
VTIALDTRAGYTQSRLAHPERIYFDIASTALPQRLWNKTITVEDSRLKQVRVAQNQPNVVRVVLDLGDDVECSVSESAAPFAIAVDIHSRSAIPVAAEKNPKSVAAPAGAAPPKGAALATQPQQDAVKPQGPKPEEPRPQESVPRGTNALVMAGTVQLPQVLSEQKAKPAAADPGPNARAGAPEAGPFSAKVSLASLQALRPAAAPPADKPPDPTPSGREDHREADTVSKPVTTGDGTHPAEAESSRANVPPAPVVADKAPPPIAALPTSKGDRTLTRMLGLKIGRIVLDPGHGGHDKGTVGPGGLLEKDLVLQVAKELKEQLEDRLGAEVILTREDDQFITLEERTAIANQHQADLFVSIHANSSPSRSTSGVETYFLDFAKTDAAREVAARENATSDRNVRDLQELVQKIAQADRQAESKELASIIQNSLYSGMKQISPSARDRGVRSAPFIVLIGAQMPSVLTEIAFLSNPRDEKLLKKVVSRQSLASALFKGIQGYMKALGSATAQNHGSSK